MEVTIVETGLANLASVRAALERLDCKVRLTKSPKVVGQASAVVLPGVGSFGAGMESLHRYDLVSVLKARIAERKPTLCICLGLQLLASTSEESPATAGIGAFDGKVQSFPNTVRSPQFGWNRITNENTSVLGTGGYVYYANSYRLAVSPSGWQSGWTDYGGPFVGCLQSGAVVGCQFHPELSGSYGAQILSRWIDMSTEVSC